MKENFMDTCLCVNFCTCALFQLSPICSANIRHGMRAGKPRKEVRKSNSTNRSAKLLFFRGLES